MTRRLLPTLIAAALTLALPAASAATAGAHTAKQRRHAPVQAHLTLACPNANLMPAPGNLDQIRSAIVCLENSIRAEHGLAPLRENARLRRAALGHSVDMVRRGYFDHTSPDGGTMVARIMGAHYARHDQGWSIGENIAWGTGSYATPSGVMRAWMNSPGHRENILRGGYRDIGVGIALGAPSDSGSGATYTTDFGVRR